jgi:uncharacterized membrane protein
MILGWSTLAVILIGLLHVIFMLGELFPWNRPLIMALVLKKWPRDLELSPEQNQFLSKIVRKTGAFNGIVAGGLFMTTRLGPRAFPFQVALLAGGIVAALFAAITLTRETIAQAFLGAIALFVVLWFRF